ncbi:MAG: MBL fold metallo-hydrolase [Phycisphaerae bacterium]|nr:MBL fold metallo-hydrolase [Phycisphaerae bacterium]
MSRVRLCVLGSGSGGNSSWLSLPARNGPIECLVDAGLSPRAVRERLKVRGVNSVAPAAILVTHADTDHWRSTWGRLVARLGIRVIARRAHHGELAAAGVPRDRLVELKPERELEIVPGVRVRGAIAPHDELGSTALRIDTDHGSVAWLTDLGRATPAVLELARHSDLLAIESNYCPELQRASRRPAFLKARIMGGRGHLSNEQCLDAVDAIEREGRPRQVVLLHLSRECNHPTRIRELWRARAGDRWRRVVVSSQTHPTPMLTVTASAAIDEHATLFAPP